MLTSEYKLCSFGEPRAPLPTTDGPLVTSSNPASSGPAAKVLIGMPRKMTK